MLLYVVVVVWLWCGRGAVACCGDSVVCYGGGAAVGALRCYCTLWWLCCSYSDPVTVVLSYVVVVVRLWCYSMLWWWWCSFGGSVVLSCAVVVVPVVLWRYRMHMLWWWCSFGDSVVLSYAVAVLQLC